MYGEANAACTPETGYNKVFKTVDIPMAVGRVVVRPTDEVGKVLRKATFQLLLMVQLTGVIHMEDI